MSTRQRKKYVYWQDGDIWLGYLEEYPDYQTQGESLEELKKNLKEVIKNTFTRLVKLSEVMILLVRM